MAGGSTTALLLALFHTVWLAIATAGEPQHGLALGAAVKYPAGFAHFFYADPRAVRGGVLTLSSLGGFDKLNPYSLKGRPPMLLNTLLFDSLTETWALARGSYADLSAVEETLSMALADL